MSEAGYAFTEGQREALVRRIVADPSLTGMAVRVGVYLAMRVNRVDGYAWPSLPTICEAVGTKHPGSVQKGIRQLRGVHFNVEERPGRRKGLNANNRYWPILDNTSHRTSFESEAKHVQEETETRPTGREKHVPQDARYSEIDPYLNPEGFKEEEDREIDQIGKAVTEGGKPSSSRQASPPELARQEGRGSVNRPALPSPPEEPEAIGFAEMMAADQSIKQARAELNTSELAEAFLAARHRARANGRNPGPIDKGFGRYVKKAIEAHCREHKQERMRRMIIELGGDPDAPSKGRSALLQGRIDALATARLSETG